MFFGIFKSDPVKKLEKLERNIENSEEGFEKYHEKVKKYVLFLSRNIDRLSTEQIISCLKKLHKLFKIEIHEGSVILLDENNLPDDIKTHFSNLFLNQRTVEAIIAADNNVRKVLTELEKGNKKIRSHLINNEGNSIKIKQLQSELIDCANSVEIIHFVQNHKVLDGRIKKELNVLKELKDNPISPYFEHLKDVVGISSINISELKMDFSRGDNLYYSWLSIKIKGDVIDFQSIEKKEFVIGEDSDDLQISVMSVHEPVDLIKEILLASEDNFPKISGYLNSLNNHKKEQLLKLILFAGAASKRWKTTFDYAVEDCKDIFNEDSEYERG